MYARLRPLLFRLDPESVHMLTLQVLRIVGLLPPLARLLKHVFAPPDMPVQTMGLAFPNPIGLAAGYDKDGLAWRGLASLGFGHIEIGTVTLRSQPGNPRPRLFRLPEEGALINRMGFPSAGALSVAARLPVRRGKEIILGINLGKNRETPLEEAAQEYAHLLEIFASKADFFTINVSSPNTEGLRRLQARPQLESLLSCVMESRQELEAKLSKRLRILVKLSPDLTHEELCDALEGILGQGVDGLVATNTTLSRAGLVHPLAAEMGGLSGLPLFARSLEMVRTIRALVGSRLTLIGVGGIQTPAQAKAMLDAGADLVQIYTALVYVGPVIVKSLVGGLLREC